MDEEVSYRGRVLPIPRRQSNAKLRHKWHLENLQANGIRTDGCMEGVNGIFKKLYPMQTILTEIGSHSDETKWLITVQANWIDMPK